MHTIKSKLDKQAISNGNVWVSTDTEQLHFDIEGVRVPVRDIIVLQTESERKALIAPKQKFYYCIDSGVLWYKNGVWKQVGANSSNVVKDLSLDLGIDSITSDLDFLAGWMIKRISVIPGSAYNSGVNLEIKCGEQTLLSESEIQLETLTGQYDSFKIQPLITTGPIRLNITGATSGNCFIYIEYVVR